MDRTDVASEAAESGQQTEPVALEPVFQVTDLTKSRRGGGGFHLTVPELIIRPSEKAALVGYSGCGKSTVLDMLAMVLKPDQAGRFVFQPGRAEPLDVAAAWDRADLNTLARARMTHLGYVLQTGGLFPFLSVRENIDLSRRVLGLEPDGVVEGLAERLGIKRHLDKLPGDLSVGERQRAAIARAMSHNPKVVIADEPTASLDPIHAKEIMDLFTELVDDVGVTLIVATHDWEAVEQGGYRRIEFNLELESDGGVRVTVVG